MFFRVLLVSGTITVVEIFHAYDERRLDLFHVSGSYSGMVFGEVRHRSSGPPVQSLIVGQTCRGQRGYARNRRVVADERRIPQERIQQRVGQLGRVLGGEHENNPNERPCSLRFFNTSSDPFASRLSSSQTSIVCLPSVNQSLQCANTVFQNRYMSHEPRILSMSSGSE